MNRNAIIGLSMMYAIWETKRQDLLSVITPFVLYCVGTSTSKGHFIDVDSVCRKMESEFGYKEIQPSVISHVLLRESKKRNGREITMAKKKAKSFVLSGNLDSLVASFNSKRTTCKERTEAVSKALANYLNKKEVYKRTNYSEADAETSLLSFFEKQGESVLSSVDDLRQLLRKDNEMDFYIARFILEEKEKQTSLFEHINELIVGYFITTAIYLQPENPDITRASFKDVTFYLDTPILLAVLGYKTASENESAHSMVSSLQKSGAKIACFDYNILEIKNILTAYRQSTFYNSRKNSGFTLEAFDEKNYSETNVDLEIRNFETRLNNKSISSISFEAALQGTDLETGLLNDERIQELVLELNPKYNLGTLPDDLKAVNTVNRLRGGTHVEEIEKCKAVFATTNTLLVFATKQYLKEAAINVGFPVAITSEELCVMAWLKSFERNSELPKMRLLENVLAAISPDRDLLEAYYSILAQMESIGIISEDEASLLRIDLFAKNELMELTAGNKNRLNTETVLTIRERLVAKMKESSYKEGKTQGIAEASSLHSKKFNEEKTKICQRVELDVQKEYLPKYAAADKTAVVLSWIVAGLFIAGTIAITIISNISNKLLLCLIALFVTAIPTAQAVLVIVKKENWLRKYLRARVSNKEAMEIDRRKEEYMRILEEVDPKKDHQ